MSLQHHRPQECDIGVVACQGEAARNAREASGRVGELAPGATAVGTRRRRPAASGNDAGTGGMRRAAQKPPRHHGPQMAKLMALRDWMLT
jgi:hypothetical protein